MAKETPKPVALPACPMCGKPPCYVEDRAETFTRNVLTLGCREHGEYEVERGKVQ